MLVLVDAAAGGFCVDELLVDVLVDVLVGVLITFGVNQLIDVVEKEIREVFPYVLLL